MEWLMPELNLCVHCEKPIYPEKQAYIITDKEMDESLWRYAHADCHEAKMSARFATAS
jgi:hypothetical protein